MVQISRRAFSSASKSRVIALLLGLVLLVCSVSACADSPASAIEGVLAAQQAAAGAQHLQDWLDNTLSAQVGSSADWYVLALRQYAAGLDYTAYAAALAQYVQSTPPASASSRLKLALTLVACGQQEHAFVASAQAEDIGRQGVMSWIYGLHLLNNLSGSDTQPVIDALLDLQLSDGGWAVMGTQSDADVTAMALQALAPHISGNKTTQQAAERATALLASLQTEAGEYCSMGIANCESTAQVIIALCALGIDPLTDTHFIRQGVSLPDVLLRYQLPDGTFAHTAGGASNAMATVQALSALIALQRLQNGQGALYVLDAPAQSTAARFGLAAWQAWAIAALVFLACLLSLLLWLRKKRSSKNFVFIWILCAALCCAACLLHIETPAQYYTPVQAGSPSPIEVTLTIRCDTVRGQTDARYIPEDGVILPQTSFTLSAGDTVYTLLIQADKAYQLGLDCRGGASPYVAGISHLNEFDFGDLSGWIYYVNGASPSVGCGEYALSDGDSVQWLYTCDLGRDL